MTGRRAKSYDSGPFIKITLPVFQLSAILPEKHHYFAQVYEEDFLDVKDKMTKEGYRDIVAVQHYTTLVPRACPLCDQRGGHPVFQRYNRTRSEQRPSASRNDQIRFKCHYNHSKPASHQCFIGYLIGGYWQLSKKIDPRKMYPDYHIKQGEIEWFEEPKMRKPRKLK